MRASLPLTNCPTQAKTALEWAPANVRSSMSYYTSTKAGGRSQRQPLTGGQLTDNRESSGSTLLLFTGFLLLNRCPLGVLL